jgi:hypothetical protein
LVVRKFRITLDLHELFVFYIQENSTTVMTPRAGSSNTANDIQVFLTPCPCASSFENSPAFFIHIDAYLPLEAVAIFLKGL